MEVVISLLIISITFLSYTQLVDQNLKAQDSKQSFINESNLRTNLLTLYVVDPSVDNYIVQDIFDISDINQNQIYRYQNVREFEIIFSSNDSYLTISVYKWLERVLH